MWRRLSIRSSWLVLALFGCDGFGCGAGSMAELLEARGTVERDRAAQQQSWKPSSVGDTFEKGDGLRTGASSSALVRVGERGRARVEANTTIRFFGPAAQPNDATPEAATGVEVERGMAVLEVGEAQLELSTRAGRATFKPGSRVELQPAQGGTRYRVLVGGASFSQAQGAAVALAAGQSIEVGIGLAVLDPVSVAPAKPTRAAPPAPAADAVPAARDAAVQDEALAADTAGDASATSAALLGARPREQSLDLSVTAGQSFRVYDPRPPTAIGFELGSRCTSGAELRVEGLPPARAQRTAVALVAPGIRPYTLRCLEAGAPGKTIARGIVRVLRSDGARALPRSAPRNAVELDGRRYNLMYQNLRPIVAVAWIGAPAASSYSFSLRTPDGRTRSWKTREPRYVVQSELLADGTHAVAMQTESKPVKRSKETLVDISFDNATPTASLELPRASGFAPGASVRIAGVTVAGSSISVDGRAIATDREHRFAASVPLASGQRSIAVRFQHAEHGTRYYLRRAIGAAR